MKKGSSMLLMVLLIGALIVVDIIVFVALGPAHLAPWLLVAATIAIPVFLKRREAGEFVTWKDEYSVGIERIDKDHKKLISLINDLETAVHYHVGDEFERKALEALVAYTQTHFKLEEELMQQHEYADYEAHKGQHDQMISNVEVYLRDYDKQGHKVLGKIANYLKLWLIEHINGTDRKYVPHLRARGVK